MTSSHPLPSNITAGLHEDRKYLYYSLALMGGVITFLLFKAGYFYSLIFAVCYFGLLALFLLRKKFDHYSNEGRGTSDVITNIFVGSDNTSFSIGNSRFQIARLLSQNKGIESKQEKEMMLGRITSLLRSINGTAMFILTAVPSPVKSTDDKSGIERFVLGNTVYFRSYILVRNNGTMSGVDSLYSAIHPSGFVSSPLAAEELKDLVMNIPHESGEIRANSRGRPKYKHFTNRGRVFSTSHKFLNLTKVDNDLWAFLTSLNIPFRIKTSLTKLETNQIGKVLRMATAEYGARIKLNSSRSGKISELSSLKKDSDRLISAMNAGSPIFGNEVIIETFSPHPAKLRGADDTILRSMVSLGLSTTGISRRSRHGCSISIKETHEYPVDAESAANLIHIPENLEEFNGIMIGIDVANSKPIFLDIFSGESYNATVLGQTGSGKSFFIKLIVRRMLEKKMVNRIIIFDPLNEYEEELFRNIDNAGNLKISFVGLNGSSSFGGGENQLSHSNKLSETGGIENAISANITILRNLKSDDAKSRLSNFRTVFQDWMTSMPKEKKIVLIDEAHLMLKTVTGREMLDNLVRHSRHYNTSVILASQNLEDFLKGSLNRSILGNSRHLFVFRNSETGNASINSLIGDDIDIPDVSLLPGGKNSAFSECIYSGDCVRRIRVIASTDEVRILG